MSWWMVPLVVLAAPTLLLALVVWGLRCAFRQVCVAVAPRPIESEEGAPAAPEPRGSTPGNRVFAGRARLTAAAGGGGDRWSLN